jgi:hypothetical protein
VGWCTKAVASRAQSLHSTGCLQLEKSRFSAPLPGPQKIGTFSIEKAMSKPAHPMDERLAIEALIADLVWKP